MTEDARKALDALAGIRIRGCVCHSCESVDVLARTVREQEAEIASLRHDCAQFCGDLERLIKAAGAGAETVDQAQAETERLRASVKGGPCETCKHQHEGDTPEWEHRPDYCGLLSNRTGSPDPYTGDVFCYRLGYGCWAWEAR